MTQMMHAGGQGTPEKDPDKKEEKKKKEGECPEPQVEDRATEAQRIFLQAQRILFNYGNQESNIPIPHDYWQLMNQYRGLVRQTL